MCDYTGPRDPSKAFVLSNGQVNWSTKSGVKSETSTRRLEGKEKWRRKQWRREWEAEEGLFPVCLISETKSGSQRTDNELLIRFCNAAMVVHFLLPSWRFPSWRWWQKVERIDYSTLFSSTALRHSVQDFSLALPVLSCLPSGTIEMESKTRE